MRRMSGPRCARGARAAAAALAVLLASGAAGASSVLSVSLGEALDGAELVFEGRVLGTRTVEPAGPRSIRTCVRFEVLEVVKGPEVAGPLELCFAGGRSGGVERTVGGLQQPAPGEHGIYVVESLAEPRLNPLAGWEQGHFLVQPGPLEAVTTAGGLPVVAVDAGARSGAAQISGGVARGVAVVRPGQRAAAPPLDAAAFKARLRALLEEGR